MVFWSDENGPKIQDFWKKFQNRPVWPVVWARKPKIVTHHYQLTLGNPPVKGLKVLWFLGLHIIPPIQHISVKNFCLRNFTKSTLFPQKSECQTRKVLDQMVIYESLKIWYLIGSLLTLPKAFWPQQPQYR